MSPMYRENPNDDYRNDTIAVLQDELRESEATATRLRELLKRLHESGILDLGVGAPIPRHDLGECEDCDLVREVEKELENEGP